MAKRKRTNNNQQNIAQKTKDRLRRTPLKPGMNSVPNGARSVTPVTNSVASHE